MVKHEFILQEGEQFELNFPTEMKELVDSCDALRSQYFIASREFMLVLTLQKRESKKFQGRLLDLTSQISSHSKRPWQEVVFGRLVTEVESHMQTDNKKRPPASVHGGAAAANEPPAKKAKKSKTEKKAKKDNKDKT